jgi:hypothetical protein
VAIANCGRQWRLRQLSAIRRTGYAARTISTPAEDMAQQPVYDGTGCWVQPAIQQMRPTDRCHRTASCSARYCAAISSPTTRRTTSTRWSSWAGVVIAWLAPASRARGIHVPDWSCHRTYVRPACLTTPDGWRAGGLPAWAPSRTRSVDLEGAHSTLYRASPPWSPSGSQHPRDVAAQDPPRPSDDGSRNPAEPGQLDGGRRGVGQERLLQGRAPCQNARSWPSKPASLQRNAAGVGLGHRE